MRDAAGRSAKLSRDEPFVAVANTIASDVEGTRALAQWPAVRTEPRRQVDGLRGRRTRYFAASQAFRSPRGWIIS
jgi:hypothetical protein